MALTYSDSATLMLDQDFRGRIQVAALHLAVYISGEAPNTTAHKTRFAWAQNCFASPMTVAGNIQPTVVMDDNVQAQGAAISDADLQVAVESAINKLM